jgi:hypothetical protein
LSTVELSAFNTKVDLSTVAFSALSAKVDVRHRSRGGEERQQRRKDSRTRRGRGWHCPARLQEAGLTPEAAKVPGF